MFNKMINFIQLSTTYYVANYKKHFVLAFVSLSFTGFNRTKLRFYNLKHKTENSIYTTNIL